MDRDAIIRLAREAGFVVDEVSQQHQPNCIFHTHHMVDDLLERFAALVAKAERDRIYEMLARMHTQEERHNYYLFIANIIRESA